MKIALDAMGGDHAPRETVRGAVAAIRELGLEVVLVGRPHDLLAEVGSGGLPPGLTVVAADDVIEMGDHPAAAVRQKRDASLMVALRLLAAGQVAAVVSAGNTGAAMAGAIVTVRRIPGIERPAIGIVMPTLRERCLLLDGGANADCRPLHLVQFATMGATYAEHVFGLSSPRVALLNIGEEETKGSLLAMEAHQLLAASDLNFVGNVEGKDIPAGAADVVVTDGFTGNVVLKTAEGVAGMLLSLLKQELTRDFKTKLLAALLRPAFERVRRRLDYAEYGGAPLLGVNGVVIIAHGRSDAYAIKQALRAGAEAASRGLVASLRERSGSPSVSEPA